MFRKYDHVERYGHSSVEGIDIGEVYVFPKLDGTNASVWFECGGDVTGPFLECSSRTRVLSEGKDNHGFFKWVQEEQQSFWSIMRCVENSHWWTIYGEWLVPHTLKTYRTDAWRQFYVFDVYDNKTHRYLSYSEYAETMQLAGLSLIEPLCIINNPTEDQLRAQVKANTYLIEDGKGAGEGIVLKNYAWKNKYGRQPWAKIVRNEFKEDNKRAFGINVKAGKFQVEQAIAEVAVTQALVDKELHKIIGDCANQDIIAGLEVGMVAANEWALTLRRVAERHRAKIIPRLLQIVFHCVVQEELWMALKKHKDPVIDFKRLRQHCIAQTKKFATELF